MRILLLCTAFNSLSSACTANWPRAATSLSVEFDIADSVSAEAAVALFRSRPDRRALPARAIPGVDLGQHVCLVVHPGIVGDRGPSALDWAIQEGERRMGRHRPAGEPANGRGPVWASASFPLRRARKSSLYRHEVTEAASCAVLPRSSVFPGGNFVPDAARSCRAARRARPMMRRPIAPSTGSGTTTRRPFLPG
jgi:putative two-component system hydrogenase maturation factor HypX/HoxX